MNQLTEIRRPIEAELAQYVALFDSTLDHADDYLAQALDYMRGRKGKMMRPILTLLVARECGPVGECSLRAAVTLELLHTASLVHDDVVDDSDERRGQASVNRTYGNKVAVLLGDYLLSSSLQQAALSGSIEVVASIARLGATLAEGEISQLSNIRNEHIDESRYFSIIENKTAALFAMCSRLGAISAGASQTFVRQAEEFGRLAGICFQIRDDIFDYYDDPAIGKPRGNDMAEGKLTLPAIYALNVTHDAAAHACALRVKAGTATQADMAQLIDFAKLHGGIEYAERKMQELRAEALEVLKAFKNDSIRQSLLQYIDFVIDRKI